jgi:hypothetical protein
VHARVATFEGDPSNIDQMVDQVRKDVESGERPPGLEDAKGLIMMVDRRSGKTIGITFFDDEEGLKRGDEALNNMSPEGPTGRTSVEFYEVPIQQMA